MLKNLFLKHDDPNPERTARIRRDLLRIYVTNHQANTFGVPLACIGFSLILYQFAPHAGVWIWLGFALAFSLISAFVYSRFEKTEIDGPGALRPWLWAIGLPRFFFIVNWSSVVFWAWSPEQPMTIILPILMVGTTMATNAATSGPFLPLYFMEIAPKIVALFTVLFLLDGPVYDAVIWFFVLGIIFVMKIAFGINRNTRTLLQQQEEILAANNTKSAFLATMSHEVRTPLNGILGMLDLLRDTRLDSKQAGYVETIRYSGETLLAMLNDVLDFSKMEAGKMRVENVPFDVHRLVRSVADLMRSRAEEKGIGLKWHVDVDVPQYIETDPTRLRQILLNLVSNAVKFTDHGHVDIRVSNQDEDDNRAVLHFSVSDSGIGIPEDTQKSLFREFAQADSSVARRYGGTGLGLAICARIVGLMGGEIGVQSRTGEGSVFWFEIPARPTTKDAIAETEQGPASYAETLPMTILVVDDNPVNRLVAQGLLDRVGHRVVLAADGPEAIAIVKDRPIDVVLMDMQMPDMDGLQATRAIRALGGSYATLPVIALTANASQGDSARCLAAGMNDFVSKPISPSLLYAALARCAPADRRVDELAVSAQTGDSDVIDLSNLQQIESSLGRPFVTRMLHDSFRETDRYLEELTSALENRNIDDVMHPAHELKTMCALLGLTGAVTVAQGLERACLERRDDELRPLADQLARRIGEQMQVLHGRFSAS